MILEPQLGVQAPKADLPPQTVFLAGQNPWKRLLQKAEQVRKAFKKQRQSLEAVCALVGLEIEPLLSTGVFFVCFFRGSLTGVY